MQKIKCYRSSDALAFNIEVPKKATGEASGFDIQALMPYGEYSLFPKHNVIIRTGLHFDIPKGYEIQIRGRSGLWFNSSISVGQLGTIDSDYTGEVKVKLINHGHEPFYINNGKRIAQGVICKLPDVDMVEAFGDIKKTDRGTGGFGHTGN